jgi:hypothetical protein
MAYQPLNTGNRAFDKQANHPVAGIVGAGNVSSGVQESQIVRARTETESNGQTYPEGVLRDSDLKRWREHLPAGVWRGIIEHTETSRATLYYWFHRSGQKIIRHGWAITDGNGGPTLAVFLAKPAVWSKVTVIETCLSKVREQEAHTAQVIAAKREEAAANV